MCVLRTFIHSCTRGCVYADVERALLWKRRRSNTGIPSAKKDQQINIQKEDAGRTPDTFCGGEWERVGGGGRETSPFRAFGIWFDFSKRSFRGFFAGAAALKGTCAETVIPYRARGYEGVSRLPDIRIGQTVAVRASGSSIYCLSNSLSRPYRQLCKIVLKH